MEKLDTLKTEVRNQNSLDLDALSSLEVVQLINSEDQKLPLRLRKNSLRLPKQLNSASMRSTIMDESSSLGLALQEDWVF